MVHKLSVSRRDRWIPYVKGFEYGSVVSVEKLAALNIGDSISSDSSQLPMNVVDMYAIRLRIKDIRASSQEICPEKRQKVEASMLHTLADTCLRVMRTKDEANEVPSQDCTDFIALESLSNFRKGDTYLFRTEGSLACGLVRYTEKQRSLTDHKATLLKILCTNAGKDQAMQISDQLSPEWAALMGFIQGYLENRDTDINEDEEGHAEDMDTITHLLGQIIEILLATAHYSTASIILEQIQKILIKSKQSHGSAMRIRIALERTVARYMPTCAHNEFPYQKALAAKALGSQTENALLEKLLLQQASDDLPFDIVGVDTDGMLLIEHLHKSPKSVFVVAVTQTAVGNYTVFYFLSVDCERNLMALQSSNFTDFIVLLQAVTISRMLQNAEKDKSAASEYDVRCLDIDTERLISYCVKNESDIANQSGLIKSLTGVNCTDEEEQTLTVKMVSTEAQSCSKPLTAEKLKESIGLLSKRSCGLHCVDGAHNGSLAFRKELLHTLYHQRKKGTAANLAPVVKILQEAKKEHRQILESLAADSSSSNVELCCDALMTSYPAFVQAMSTIRQRRADLAFCIVSDRESFLEQFPAQPNDKSLGTNRLSTICVDSMNLASESVQKCCDRLQQRREAAHTLLKSIEHEIWNNASALQMLEAAHSDPSIPASFPIDCLLACHSTSESALQHEATQGKVNFWVYDTPTEIDAEYDDGTAVPALFRVPLQATDAVAFPSDVPSENSSVQERLLFAIQCTKYHSFRLQGLYFETVSELQHLHRAQAEIAFRWSELDKVTKQTVFSVHVRELLDPKIRAIFRKLDPSAVLIDAASSKALPPLLYVLTKADALQKSYALRITSAMDDTFAPPCDVHVRFPEKHSVSAGLRAFQLALQNETSSVPSGSTAKPSATTGIQYDAFIWTLPIWDTTLFCKMALELFRYIHNAQWDWEILVLAPDDLMAHSGVQGAARLIDHWGGGTHRLVSMAEGASITADVQIALLSEGHPLDASDLVQMSKNSRHAFYAIAAECWLQDTCKSLSDDAKAIIGGPSLRLSCTKGHAFAMTDVYVDFQKKTPQAEQYAASLHFPPFGTWCELPCLQRFRNCSNQAAHVCQQNCVNCGGNHERCPYPCPIVLACGHTCAHRCGEPCGECREQIVRETQCDGSRCISGYDTTSKTIQYATVPHFREAICCDATAAGKQCTSTDFKPCLRCGADVDVQCGGEAPRKCVQCSKIATAHRELLLKRNTLQNQKIALQIELDKHTAEKISVNCPNGGIARRWRELDAELTAKRSEKEKKMGERMLADQKAIVERLREKKASIQRSTQLAQSYLKVSYPSKCQDVIMHGLDAH